MFGLPKTEAPRMIRLTPMTPPEFDAFWERAIPEYAEEKVRAGNWLADGALEQAFGAFRELLPNGLATPGNHLFSIELSATGQTAGLIWLAEERSGAPPTGAIFELYVEEGFRRRGIARQAMLAIEPIARQFGLQSLRLHVFGHNAPARALYESLGYGVTNVNMAKPLM